MEEYLKIREAKGIEYEKLKYGNLQFTEQELKAANIFQSMMLKEHYSLPQEFFLHHSIKYKDQIMKSQIYQILRKMPKGAVHHVHTECCMDPEWFLDICKTDSNVYLCHNSNKYHYLTENSNPDIKSVMKLREAAADKVAFDNSILESVQVLLSDRSNKERTWVPFQTKIDHVLSFVFAKQIYPRYLRYVFERFYEEGVRHFEGRSLFSMTDNLKPLDIHEQIGIHLKVYEEFKKDHPDFSYVIVSQGLKVWNVQEIEENMRFSIKLAKQYPDLIKGYDLVCEEDACVNLKDLLDALTKKKKIEEEEQGKIDYVFHGGESLFYVKSQNLLDTLLLDTKRIGHGINLFKHSYLMEEIRDKGICIETNPLSNQILDYVYDLRTHPLINWYNFGIKISINSDDPGILGNYAITFDHYMVAVALEFDLRDFKRVCLNSLECSLQNADQKKKKIEEWNRDWDMFIAQFLKEFE